MSLFISSNSTNALTVKTESLEKKLNELGEQKKSTNSFIKKIKSFRNSSTKAGIRKKLEPKSIKTLKKELKKADVLRVKLESHSIKLEKKLSRKNKAAAKAEDKLKQFLSGTDAALKTRLLRKIDRDLNNATNSSRSHQKTRDMTPKLKDKIESMNIKIAWAESIEELKDELPKIRYNTTIHGVGFSAKLSVNEFRLKKDNNDQSGVNASGDLIELRED